MIFYYKPSRKIEDRVVDGILYSEKLFGKKVFNKDGTPTKYYLEQGKEYKLHPKIKELYNLEEIEPNVYLMDSNEPGKVIIYIHGGAYWLQPLFFHYRMIHSIIKETKGVAIIPIYPKAPYATYQDVYDFITPIYEKYKEIVGAKNIVLMGDSAGGGFIISFAMELAKRKEEVPTVIAISPWLKLECTPNTFDPMLNAEVLTRQGSIFAKGLDIKDPKVSPFYGDPSVISNLNIFTGTQDILSIDTIEFEKKNPNMKVFVYPKRNHDFPLYPIGTGSKDATNKIISIIKGVEINE